MIFSHAVQVRGDLPLRGMIQSVSFDTVILVFIGFHVLFGLLLSCSLSDVISTVARVAAFGNPSFPTSQHICSFWRALLENHRGEFTRTMCRELQRAFLFMKCLDSGDLALSAVVAWRYFGLCLHPWLFPGYFEVSRKPPMHQGRAAAGKIKHWLSKRTKKQKTGSLRQSIAVVDPVNGNKSMETASRAKQSIASKTLHACICPVLLPSHSPSTRRLHPGLCSPPAYKGATEWERAEVTQNKVENNNLCDSRIFPLANR